MPVLPSNPQGIQPAIVVITAIAAYLCVAYARTLLRVILFVLIALAIYGGIVGFEGATSLIASHHR
jgi:hypothetical protein